MVEHSQLRNVAPGTLRLAVDKLPAPPDLAEGTCSCIGAPDRSHARVGSSGAYLTSRLAAVPDAIHVG